MRSSSWRSGRGGNYRGNGRPRGHWGRGSNRGRNSGLSDRAPSRTSSSSVSQASTRAPANQAPITIFVSEHDKVWKLYFPSQDRTAISTEHISCFKAYINKIRSAFDLEKIDRTRSVTIDLLELQKDEEFSSAWPNFKEDLFDKPEETLRLLEFSIHEELKAESRICVRVMNHEPTIPLTSLKVNYFGKLVTIKGTVIRVGSAGLICTSAAFQCTGCHVIQAVQQPQGVFTVPTFCSSCKKSCKLDALLTSPFTITDDWQVTKIQEIQSQSVSGTIPRSVEVELQGNLVGAVCPGDVLSITGIVQVRGESRGGEDGRRSARLLQLYIQAVSVNNQRNLSSPALAFTLTDYYAIQEIHNSEDVFRLLVHSLCPSIFGQEAVKAGLLLGLFGGTISEGSVIRSDPHVLVVGDPGLGKSRLLQAAAHAAPRGVYVCGATASAGGLTVALGREAGGEYALEAGALVLADRGVCCVDELDKMAAHHSSLLEAMEQGRVSVAKGGVTCSLSARSTVLAAANPAAGNYNRAKTVAENLKMNSALLSRFDLVFILLDQPNEKRDALLSEHVLAMHVGNKMKNNSSTSKSTAQNVDLSSQNTEGMSLSKRLCLKPGEVIDTLPTVLLRKYIAYARRYVHPKLSAEAANILQEFYLELRRNYQSGQHDGTPITTRQLEACVRLTQARAKAELREEATSKDAEDVISLMKRSLTDTFSDEFGNIQLSRSIHGSGVSARSSLKRFLEALRKYAHQMGKDVFSKQELCQIHTAVGIKGDPQSLIESMHDHSYLLLKGSNLYQLIFL